MKKGMKIVGIVLVVFLAILIVLPFAFKGKLEEIAKTEGHKILNAKFDFSSLDLSFIRNFPQATVSLNDFYLVGVDAFESDTLVAVKELSISVNIMSVLGNDGIQIGKVLLDEPSIHAKIMGDGTPNWNIMKETGTQTADTATSTESNTMKLALKKLTIKDAKIVYEDLQGKMKATVLGFDLTLKGDFSAKETQINTDFSVDDLSFVMGNVAYLNRAEIEAAINLDANLETMKFVLKKNMLRLNAIQTGVDGWVQLLEKGYDMDLTLNTSKVQFKEILSLIPAIYAKDFENIKTSGAVSLTASAKGKMENDNLPAFNVKLNVDDAMFQYPSLPQSVKDINMSVMVTNPGGTVDQTIVDVPKFHFNMAGNPFDIQLHLATLISDPDVQASASGKLNLGAVKEIYPLEDVELQGELDANMKVAGKYSFVEKGMYDQFMAEGSLQLKEMDLKGDSLPSVIIQNMLMKFSPQYVNLSETKIVIGKNDLAVSGNLENMLGYVLKGDVLKGNLSISSNYMNLNELLESFSSEEYADVQEDADTTSVTVVEVPKNLDFVMSASFGKILFQKMVLNDSKGNLSVRDGKISIENLSTNTLGGAMSVNGYYSTAKGVEQPDLNFNLDMRNVSFVETFKTFDLVQQLAPIFEDITGNFSTKININTPLGTDFTPILESLTADGLLASQDVSVKGVKAMEALASALKNDNLKQIVTKDVNIPFNIKGGRVYTNPFDLKMGDIKMNLAGSTGLNKTIDYVAKVTLPGKTNLGGLVSTANIKIGGTFTEPKVSIGTEEMVKEALTNLKGKAEDKLLNALGSDKATTAEELEAQKEKLIKEAETTGQKLIEEAEKAGDKLVKEAKDNILAKTAAKAAAKKLVKEAEKQAAKLKTAAEKNAQKIIDSTKTKE